MNLHPTAVEEEKGFSAVEMLLSLIIVIMITFVGYYIYNTKHKTDDTYKAASVAAQASVPKDLNKATTASKSNYIQGSVKKDESDLLQ